MTSRIGNLAFCFALAAALVAGAACMSQAEARDANGPLAGLQSVGEPLPWFDAERNYAAHGGRDAGLVPNSTVAVTSRGRPPMEAPVSLRLSRFRYPAEDGHLDALVRFDMDLGQTPEGRLELVLADAGGAEVSRAAIADIPGSQLHFSYSFPAEMAGASGELRLTWQRPGADAAEASAAFEVAPAAGPERSGRIRLTVPNDTGAVLASAPMTVGVPFPRGALDSVDNLRLVDEQGQEIPLQAEETARWARFGGGVKWALCSFAADLDGGPREVFLEYGSDVSRAARPGMAPVPAEGAFPSVEAGRLRLGAAGVAFDAQGDGDFRRVLGPEALAGAFVEKLDDIHAAHSRLTAAPRYAVPADVRYEAEEAGPEKVALRAEGWFVHEESGRRFCKFVNRYEIHRDSPVLRVFHTWIYTGNDKKDFIRNMGWRFPVEGMSPKGFLSEFGEGGEWLEGDYLRQHAHDEYGVYEVREVGPHSRLPEPMGYEPVRPLRELALGRRAPGVAAAEGDGVRVHLGVRDFWQNYPSSMKAEEGALTFYQWPRYGKPREELPERGDVWRLWFAHQGENLSFQLPRKLTEGPLFWSQAGREPHFAYGRPDSANAQGIAKTAEMWLYFAPADEPAEDSAKVMQGLNEESLRAVVDPAWMAASGAFYEMVHADFEARPELERVYDENARSVIRQGERMDVYGKWIYGDIVRTANLDERTASGLYRIFRKAHWGWPFSWTPFARSGDLEFLRSAQAATRMMSDTAFCHYVSDELKRYFAEELPEHQIWVLAQPHRRKGWHNRNLIPWAGYWGTSTRCYVDQADYLWDAWHVTGYRRAKDVALVWAEQTKIEEEGIVMRGPITAAQNRARWPANLQKQYLEMYEYTWDPWFLAGAQAIADMHVWRHREEDWSGHFWHAGYQTWQRYSGCPEHKEFVLANAESRGDWQNLGWARHPSTNLPAKLFGYYLTGDETYLRRAAGVGDLMRWAVYSGEEPDYYLGFMTAPGRVGWHLNATSWAHKWMPQAFAAFEEAGGVPERPIPVAFDQTLGRDSRIAVRKAEGEPLTLRTQGRFTIVGPDGQTFKEGDDGEAVLEAEAPAGTYFVQLGRRRPRVPISPPDTPEVLLPGEGETVQFGQRYAQHWFMVPEGTESFWIEFDNPAPFRQVLRQVIVWTPDGEEAWAHRERAVDHDPEQETIRAEVRVAPGQDGRLWRLTLPGMRSMPFRLGPNLPRILSHDPVRWFAPAE